MNDRDKPIVELSDDELRKLGGDVMALLTVLQAAQDRCDPETPAFHHRPLTRARLELSDLAASLGKELAQRAEDRKAKQTAAHTSKKGSSKKR